MPTETEVNTRLDRRERFRIYMQKLNPTAPAQTVIELGLASTDLHESLYEKLAARADLDPGSQQLLVGGIGSGKTTELLLAQRWLNEKQESVCLFIDISAETDLSGLHSGAIVAGFGVHLSRAFRNSAAGKGLSKIDSSEVKKYTDEVKHFAFGKTESIWVPDDDYPEQEYEPDEEPDYEPDYEPGHYVRRTTPGKLQPPFPALQRDLKEITKALEFFISRLRSQQLDTVVIFDGLDRLLTPEKFWSVVHQDFRALRSLGVAVLAAAPLSVLYGKGRSVTDHFDRVHHIASVSIDPGKTAKLKSVLVQRGAAELALRPDIERIAKASGGVLRDLITLARDAGEAAYLDGSDGIKSTHVRAAAKQLGEGYLRGLSAGQLKLLRKLARDRSIDLSSEPAVELLATRRILEYSATDFRVHPALEPLIKLKEENA
jgi:hypothetical protein